MLLLAFAACCMHALPLPHRTPMHLVAGDHGRRAAGRPAVLPARVLRGRRPADPLASAVGVRRPASWPTSSSALAYCPVSRGLAGLHALSARPVGRLQHCVGFSGPVQFGTETRSDLLRLPDRARSACSRWSSPRTCSCARPGRPGRLGRPDAQRIRELLERHGDQDSLGYFTLRNDKSIIWSATGQGVHRLPGALRRDAGQRRPASATRRRGRARSTRSWTRRPGTPGCLPSSAAASSAPRSGAGRASLTALELGDEAVVSVADFTPAGPFHAQRPADGGPGRAGAATWPRSAGSATSRGTRSRRLIRQADRWRGSPTERGFSMALGRVGGDR